MELASSSKDKVMDAVKCLSSGAVKTEVNASITLSSDTLTEYHAALEYAPTRGATKTICDLFKVFSCQARSLSG